MSEATAQQQAVIDDVAGGGGGDIVVVARAGSGKTTTILRAIGGRPRGTTAILCAFNRDIAQELKVRTSEMDGVTARTLHGIGLSAIRARFRNATFDGHREKRHALQICGEDAPPIVREAVVDLAGTMKECAPDKATDHDEIWKVGQRMGLIPSKEELDDTSWSPTGVVRAAGAVVEMATDMRADSTISHADMLYLPLALRLSLEPASIVAVDELQDLSRAQHLISLRMRRAGARLIGVGDDRQCIYSWRGADPAAIARLRTSLRATQYSLTVTHRCDRAIVTEAQRIVPDLEPSPKAGAGVVRSCAWRDLATGATPGDFVIGRTNAIITLAGLRLMRKGTRVRVVGSDLGPTMSALVKRLSRGLSGDSAHDMATMAERIANWQERAIRTAKARQSDAAEALARDKAGVMDAILDDCDTIEEMQERIVALFTDDGQGHVVCSTVHKAKGLEADRVWMLDESFTPPRKDATPIEVIEADNLRYVTITRARHELVHVLA